MNQNAVKTFDVVIQATGKAVGKMRNEVTVVLGNDGGTFEMATDEGPMHGGESSAPPPLAYFATGLTACLMTQIRAFSKRLKIPINDVSVVAKCHWRGTMIPDEPYETEPIGFDLDIDIDSDADLNDLTHLISTAKKGCFIEQTLGQTNTIGHRLKFQDKWVEI